MGIFDKLDKKTEQEQRVAKAERDRRDAFLYRVARLVAVYEPILKSFESELTGRGYTVEVFFNGHYFNWNVTAPGGHSLGLSVYDYNGADQRLCADIDGLVREANPIERIPTTTEARAWAEKWLATFLGV